MREDASSRRRKQNHPSVQEGFVSRDFANVLLLVCSLLDHDSLPLTLIPFDVFFPNTFLVAFIYFQLPYRYSSFEFVNQILDTVNRLFSMRTGHGQYDARLADWTITQNMTCRNLGRRRKLGCRVIAKFKQFFFCHGHIAFISQFLDDLSFKVVSSDADEGGDCSTAWTSADKGVTILNGRKIFRYFDQIPITIRC
jgi:hypothetical protein